MKTIKSLITCMCIFVISCSAQKKISSIENNSIVKINLNQYKVEKSQTGAKIENLSNKFLDTKQSSPNLPANVNLRYLKKTDLNHLTEICATYISSNQLLELIRLKDAGLLIDIRCDIKGDILEVGFFTGKNSILTINQLEEIEKAIKKEVKIEIKPEDEKFLKGSNYILIDPLIFFTEILKLK